MPVKNHKATDIDLDKNTSRTRCCKASTRLLQADKRTVAKPASFHWCLRAPVLQLSATHHVGDSLQRSRPPPHHHRIKHPTTLHAKDCCTYLGNSRGKKACGKSFGCLHDCPHIHAVSTPHLYEQGHHTFLPFLTKHTVCFAKFLRQSCWGLQRPQSLSCRRRSALWRGYTRWRERPTGPNCHLQ